MTIYNVQKNCSPAAGYRPKEDIPFSDVHLTSLPRFDPAPDITYRASIFAPSEFQRIEASKHVAPQYHVAHTSEIWGRVPCHVNQDLLDACDFDKVIELFISTCESRIKLFGK
jgi:hypothetical protein